MIFSDKLRYRYLGMPKAASSTITSVLEKFYDGKVHFGQHNTEFPETTNEYFTFTTVRNPYARFLSAMAFTMSFNPSECAKLYHAIPMTTFLSYVTTYRDCIDTRTKLNQCLGNYRPVVLDAVLHVENLEKEFNQLPFVTSSTILPTERPGTNASILLKGHENKICDYVAEHYKEDFERFGYDINDRSIVNQYIEEHQSRQPPPKMIRIPFSRGPFTSKEIKFWHH